ncbi:hypothetical protein P7V88_004311 [Salmonella enterica]|nr:hypothetical protein [Salmonella enterica subsp. enterica]EDU0380521.1 hypothetical protein [Salmonella enterica subsp. enterica]EGT9726593.1 hypothetical protein [Salmonella enterica]EHW1158249.1 hypothetical protein [Salmonella enterica subsp. enterica serovar Takoradi]EKR0896039.1 hypothetical protein [Salmonella enterica]
MSNKVLKVERTEQGRAKIAGPEVQQEKTTETHGKYREKTLSSQQCAPDRVVVENNLLGGSEWLQTSMVRMFSPVVIILPVKPVSGAWPKTKLMQRH